MRTNPTNLISAAAFAGAALCFGQLASATILLEYDAANAGGNAPADVTPAWQQSGFPMVNIGSYLLQDNTFNEPQNDYGEYYSPTAENGGIPTGTFLEAESPYGIEFRVRPLNDVAFLGYAWPELYLSWSDDQYNYNVTIDQFHESNTSGNGDVVYGRGSFTPAIRDIDWTVPHTVFIGHRPGVFDFYLDGVIKSSVVEGSIARDRTGWAFLQDRISFGDGTTGGPGSNDVAAEWYFIRVYDQNTPIVPPSEWKVNQDGNWSEAANWTNGVPNSLTGTPTATFGSAINAPRTVSLDAPQTIGYVNFDNANRYTVAGPGTLTFSIAGSAAINVIQGSHTISAPVLMTSPVNATVSAGNTLTMSGGISAGTGATLTKLGAGTLEMNQLLGYRLNVDSGTAKVLPGASANSAAGASKVVDLVIAGGPAAPTATLDLTNNSFIIDYTGASPEADVRQLLAAGATSGNGIISSSADANRRLGYADNGGLGLSTFAGQSVDADSLLIKFTYAGDTNLDGQVDVIDLGNLATAWQTNANWIAGDSNYDGFVDVIDLGLLATNWQAGVGSPLGPGSLDQALAAYGLPGVSVPEPAALAGLGMLAMITRLRRRRA